MTPLEWGLAIALVAFGAVVQGSVGIGLNLLAGTVLVQMEPAFVPGPMLMVALAVTTNTLWRERQELRLGQIGWALAGRVPGSVLALLALAAMSSDGLAIVLASAVLVGVAVSATRARIQLNRPNLFAAGVASGLMATTTGVGGPPLALVYQRSEGPNLRANLAALFVVGSLFSLFLLTLDGRIGLRELGLAAPLWPAALAGFWASNHVIGRIDERVLRPALLTLAGAAALVLLVRTLAG